MMKNRKAPYIIILAVILLGAAGYLIFKFTRPDKSAKDMIVPTVEKVEIQLVNLTSERADMNVHLIIRNPAPIGLDIDSLYYRVSIEGTEISKSIYPSPITLSSRDTSALSIPLSLRYKDYRELLDEMEKKGRDSGNYHLDATIYINSKLIPGKQYDLAFDKMMPLIWFPEVSLKGIDPGKVRLNGGIIEMETEISNKNRFPVSFKNLSYRMKLGDNDWIEGKKPELVNIPAKGTSRVDLPVEVKLGAMGKSLFDMITKGDNLKYEMKMQADIVSDNRALKNSKMQMDASGNLGELKEALKK